MNDSSSRINSLDSIRGIAAVIVLIHHCLLMTPLFNAAHYNEPYDNWFAKLFTNSILHTFWAGHESVILFFILSGFVLTLPFLKKDVGYGGYLVNRFFRIYMPYIVVMAIASLLMVMLADYNGQPYLIDSFSERRWDHPLDFKAVISYILMLGYDNTNVDGPTWSLIHEMRISIIFPLLMLLVIRSGWIKSLVIGLGVCFIGWCGFFAAEKLIEGDVAGILLASFKDTFFYTCFFVIGAVFAKYRDNVGAVFIKLGSMSKFLLVIVALTLINLDETFFFLRTDSGIGIVETAKVLLMDLLVAPGVIILFCFAIFSTPTIRVLTKPAFMWLGKISYSLYLTHMVVLITTMYTLGMVIPVYIALALVPVFALIVAPIVNYLVEVPSQKLGKRLASKLGQSKPVTTETIQKTA